MSDFSNRRIFIVDDDAFWTKVLIKQLSNLGYHCVSAFKNGEDCLENLRFEPEIIFLDYQMEGENGLAILKKIKQVNEDIYVVFCTSKEDLSVALSAIHFGSIDYLLKSNLNEKELGRIMNKLS